MPRHSPPSSSIEKVKGDQLREFPFHPQKIGATWASGCGETLKQLLICDLYRSCALPFQLHSALFTFSLSAHHALSKVQHTLGLPCVFLPAFL